MNKKIVIHSGEESSVIFDTEKAWFYYVNGRESVDEIEMIRPGCFDLTEAETNSVSKWIMELINGVLKA